MKDELARQLHDRATRGEELTAVERERLERWYSQQDQEEAALLSASAARQPVTADLQREIDAALAQLSDVTERIQTISAENEALRREIVVLSRRLARADSSRAA